MDEVRGAVGVRAGSARAWVEDQVVGSTQAGAVAIELRCPTAAPIGHMSPARRWAASSWEPGAQPVARSTAHSRTVLVDVGGLDQTELATLFNTVHVPASNAGQGRISERG
jgi:hypothetical protein